MPAIAPLITHLLDCSFSTFPDNGIIVPEHLHHFHQLDVIVEGRVQIGLGGSKSVRAMRGQAVLLPPLCRHSYKANHGFGQATFKFHLAPKHWTRFGHTPLHTKLPAHLLHNLEDAKARAMTQAPLHQEQAIAAATLCLVALLKTNSNENSQEFQVSSLSSSLWSLLERIENEPFADWSVAKLAHHCHLSSDHFSRCFFQLMQRTPQRYLLETRMKSAAAGLLQEPILPVKKIAKDCGYASVHAFSRAFKIVFDCGPAAYRQSPREM